jgi:uncharacterized protein
VTLALDTTALLARYIGGPARDVVVAAMADDHEWCVSALALTESLMLVDRATELESERTILRRALRDDWERMHVVPVEQRCLDRAAELGRTQPVRSADAIHLAAADRLPRPVRYCTFDPNQITVALAMGFTVVST